MADVRELAELIEQYAETDGIHTTAIQRLILYRASQIEEPMHAVYEPAVCIVAQGRKQSIAGEGTYVYDAEKYLVVSVGIPAVGRILEASPDRPYLCLALSLEPAAIGELMLESDIERAGREQPASALAVSTLDRELLDACLRLLRLLGTPRDISVLAPLAEREILYRLLRGDQATRMSQLACAEGRLQDVNRAISWIKRNFRAAFSVDTLASEARMSASALHQHFKTVTGTSPLQFQKHLRLLEARRLMLGEAMDAAVAAHTVGYESPSQFNREYRRLFGAPPVSDMAKLRARWGNDIPDFGQIFTERSTATPKSGVQTTESEAALRGGHER
jgi:AraC-like DNA-binding protein